MGACRGMCQYATAGTPCDCKCGGTLHGIRAGLHAPLTHAGKLHIDLEHAGQLAMIFDDAAEPTAETTCVPAVDSAAAEEAPMKEVAGGGTTSSHEEATGTGGAGLATAGPAPEAISPGEEHGATELPLQRVQADDSGPGVDSPCHGLDAAVEGPCAALPGVPHGSAHPDCRRSVLLDGFRVVPVTREWCEGGVWREWCGWRIDDKRGPFYGDTPEDAVVAARRGSLRIVRAAA